MRHLRNCSGLTLVEMMVATAVTALALAGAAVGVMTLQKSFIGSKQYAAGMNDGGRLVDYISRDLRNAVTISRRDSGVVTPLKRQRVTNGTTVTWVTPQSLEVTDLNQLVLTVPDYFVSNVPDNGSGSNYKSPIFGRSRLPAGQTYFPYYDVVEIVGTARVPKYPSFLEVRYVKKARSAQDPTICYFRQEYEGSTLRSERDIAEDYPTGRLIVQWIDDRRFRVLTSFAPKWSAEAARNGTRQFSSVQILNKRRD